MTSPKVCMVSSTHDGFDDRIYWKEAISLKKAGYAVSHVFSGEKNRRWFSEEKIEMISIYEPNTYLRIRRIIEAALKVAPDVYHLHDLKLHVMAHKFRYYHPSSKIISDVHEHYPDAIRDYSSRFKKLLNLLRARIYDHREIKSLKYIDFVITADDAVAARFRSVLGNNDVDIIYNFTDMDLPYKNNYGGRKFDLVYCGGITKLRGVFQLLETIRIGKNDMPEISLLLLGPVSNDLKREIINYLKKHNIYNNVYLVDRVPYKEVSNYLSQCKIGMVLLLPIPKYKKNIPIKLFEYMAHGLPVVGSDLPTIRRFVEGACSGILVDPLKPDEIYRAVKNLLTDTALYNTFSYNGWKKIRNEWNWNAMEEKLLSLYDRLLSSSK